MFYDRKEELEYLSEMNEKSRKKPMFLVITGRRRVGKTALVREFLKKNRGVYLFIEVKDENLIFQDAERAFEPILGFRPKISSWEDIFKISGNKCMALVLDEFQNLMQVNKSAFSKIQRIWDEMEERCVFLITVGSHKGMMKRIFMDAKEPLFGRADNIMFLRPFNFIQTCEFLEEIGISSFKRKIEMYSVLGGVPKYLLQGGMAGKDFLWELFYSNMAPLRDEGKNILILEFGKEHKGYFSILEAVSKGKSTQKEITDYTGMPKDTVGKYLFELTNEYGILKKVEPAPMTKKNMGRYRIDDNFYSFWFRFIYSRESLLEIDPEKARAMAEKELPDHIGRVFEDIVREIIVKKGVFEAERIGSWWNRRGDEIDIVALNEKRKEILFGEVKWRSRPVGCNILDELMEKKDLVKWHNEDRKEKFLIVSKSGFTRKCLERMDDENIIHWDLGLVERLLRKP